MCYPIYVKWRVRRVRQEERKMRHWIWRILLAAMVSAALAGTALAAEPIDWSVMEDEKIGRAHV